MLNHLTLGQSLIKQRLDEPSHKVRTRVRSHAGALSWLQHHMSGILRHQTRR